MHKPSSSFLRVVVVPIFFHYKSESVLVGVFLLEEDDVGVFGEVVVPNLLQRRRRTRGIGVSQREKKEREKETSFLSFSNSISL